MAGLFPPPVIMSERKRSTSDKRRRKKRRRRSRFPQLLLTVCILVLAALCLIFLGRTFFRAVGNSPAGTESGSTVSESAEVLTDREDQDGQGEPDATPTPEMIILTEDMIHTGDLILVNSSYPYDFAANESSIGLVNIRGSQSFYYQVEKTDYEVSGRMLPSLDQMIAACDAAMGTSETGITSAYRSYEYQQNVWDTTVEQSGEDYARAYVAIPGYSEHHTGLAVDIGIFYSDGSQGSFSESQNAVWMDEHSSEFGFVRRYAEDKVDITGIRNEKWHFRYVGLPHAVYMKQNNLCLEEYLEYLSSQTSAENPLTVSTSSGTYYVWYTTETSIPKPNGDYQVSGDNIAGYIITVQE